jgi:predicted dehydrogenase
MKKVLIIGTGGIGKRHIRGFLKTGRSKLWVVEPAADKLAEVLRDYAIEDGYSDLGKADLSSFDLAVICAPAHLHVPMGLKCAEAGVPFLTEKPLSVTMDGVDVLLAKVKEKGIVARVAYVRRSSMENIEMHRQLKEGRIGELRMAYMNASQDFPKYRPDYQTTYYSKAAMGGGCILDLASHMIDMAVWFFGEPIEVASMYDRLQLKGVECEDCSLISIRFRSGCLVQLSLNQFQKPNKNTIEVIGTKGNLMLDFATLKYADDDSGRWDEKQFFEGLKPMEAHEARFAYQANLMLDTIEGKPSHMTTLEEARTSLRVALAAKQSDREKRIIKLEEPVINR